MSLSSYMLGWTTNQYYALLFKEKFPDRVHIVRAEDVMSDSHKTLGAILRETWAGSSFNLRSTQLEQRTVAGNLSLGNHSQGHP